MQKYDVSRETFKKFKQRTPKYVSRETLKPQDIEKISVKHPKRGGRETLNATGIYISEMI